MNSRERGRAALEGRPLDRLPIDLGGTTATGIGTDAHERLRAELRLPSRAPLIDAQRQLAWPEDDLRAACGIDTRRAIGAAADATNILAPDGRPLLAAATTPREIEAFFARLPPRARIERLESGASAETRLSIADPGLDVLGVWRFRGFEQALCDLIAERALAETLLDAYLDWSLRALEDAPAGADIDVVFVGDDLAGQHGLILAPDLYRRVLAPRHARLFAALRAWAPGARLLFHSCGAVAGLLPALIDLGIDAFGPFQPEAPGMEPQRLKREFGGAVVLWGGACDTRTLLRGSPDDVTREVNARLDILARGAGYIFASSQDIPPETPAANLLAMLDAARVWPVA